MIDQRVAIVTGGARGIGAAISSSLARSGVHVAAGYSRNQSAAEDLASKLSAEGASVSVHQGNVGVPEDCQRVVGTVPASIAEKIVAGIPVGRLGHADEIARAVQFLVEDNAGYITGSVISVNGGMDM